MMGKSTFPRLVDPAFESWMVGEVIDFMESCLPRNKVDLRLHGLAFAEVLARARGLLEERVLSVRQRTLEDIAAEVAVPALAEVEKQPNRRLKRERKLVPLESLRAQDARCLMWLARRPGRTLNEQLTKHRQLLGVVRELSACLTENRVAHSTAVLLEKVIRNAPLDVPDKLRSMQLSTLREFLRFAAREDILLLRGEVRPNNALLRDRKYRRIWLAYGWLCSIEDFRQAVRESLCRCVTEAIALAAGSVPESCGFELADAGISCVNRPSGDCGWVRDGSLRWFRVGPGWLDLLDLDWGGGPEVPRLRMRLRHFPCSKAEESMRKTGEVVWHPEITDGSIALVAEGFSFGKAIRLSRDTCCLRKAAESVARDVRQYLEPASDLRPSTSRVPDALTGALLMRISLDGILLGAGRTPCFGVSLAAGEGHSHDRILLIGRGVRNQRILGMTNSGCREWIMPGRFTRTLYRPGARNGVLRKLMQQAEAAANGPMPVSAVAIPGGLPFGAEDTLRSALRPQTPGPWMIPQLVAVAISCRWGMPSPIEPEMDEFVVAADFNAECCDAALLKWTKIERPDKDPEPGWLHFREVLGPMERGPWLLRVVRQMLVKHLRHAGLIGREFRRAFAQALHQLSPGEWFGLTATPERRAEVWVAMDTDTPVCLEVSGAEVLEALTRWMKESALPWLSTRLARWRDSCAMPSRLLLNGQIFLFPEMRRLTGEWAAGEGLTPPVFLTPDGVRKGLDVFLSRQAADDVTWSEHLPVLKIQSRNRYNRDEWFRLFDKDASVVPRTSVLQGEEIPFECPRRVVALPMMCDEVIAGQDPCLELSEHCPLPVTLLLRAQYDVGRGGLVLKVWSKEPGLVPEVAMEWGKTVAQVHVPQELEAHHDPVEVTEFLRELKVLEGAMKCHFVENGPQDKLRQAVDSLGQFLDRHLRSSEVKPWAAVPLGSLAEISCRLTRMHEIDLRTYQSLVSGVSCVIRASELTSGVAGTRFHGCRESLELQKSLTRALGKLRAAAPESFVEWVLEKGINVGDRELRHESIRSLGRLCCPYETPTMNRVRQAIVAGVSAADHAAAELDRSIWHWCFHAALSYSEDSIEFLGPDLAEEILHVLLWELGRFVDDASRHKPDELRNILAALLAVRLATRLEGGMERFGPDSTLARESVAKLRAEAAKLSTIWQSEHFKRVKISKLLELAQRFRSDNPIMQVAGCWAGQGKPLLRQSSDE
jgi:hypothetical protein